MMQVNLKFVLCIIYIIMILGAIISLPFLVMVVGNKVNSYHRTQALEMVSKREATGVSKARFTPPKIDNNSHESQHGHNQHRHRHRHHLNHHEQHQHDQQDQQELHQQSSHSSISPLSPSLPALELTFTNTDQQQSPSSLQSVASFESSDTLHRLSPSSSQSISASTTSLHHHTKRKRRKKKRIRDEIQVDEQPPLETQTDTNLIELNTYFNSSPAPSSTLSPPSALILNSFPLPKRDYLYDSKNDDNGRRTSSKLHDNLNIEESSNNKNTFTAKYYYLYNRCSGHKVQILGMKKVSAAPLTTSSGQSQLSPSTSFHRSNRHHHSLMYLLHHQEQLPVSFSTTGDLLDDDYAVMSLESYNLGLDPRTNVPRIGIKIRGKKSGLFLCYNKRGKLVNKFMGSSSGCLYTESPSDNNYWTFDSVLNADWSIGFNRRGKPLPGHISESVTVPRSISSRKGKCHQFVKLPVEIKLIEERKKKEEQNEEEAENSEGTDDEDEDEDEISTLNRD